MEIDTKTVLIGGLALVVLFLILSSGGASSTGAAVSSPQVSNLPSMVGGC